MLYGFETFRKSSKEGHMTSKMAKMFQLLIFRPNWSHPMWWFFRRTSKVSDFYDNLLIKLLDKWNSMWSWFTWFSILDWKCLTFESVSQSISHTDLLQFLQIQISLTSSISLEVESSPIGRYSSQRQLRLDLELLVRWSVRPSVYHFFLRTALRIFMKLGSYVGIDIMRKQTRAFLGKKSGSFNNSKNVSFLRVFRIFLEI